MCLRELHASLQKLKTHAVPSLLAAASGRVQRRVHHLTAPGQDRVLTGGGVHFSDLMFLERRECRYVYITLVRRNIKL